MVPMFLCPRMVNNNYVLLFCALKLLCSFWGVCGVSGKIMLIKAVSQKECGGILSDGACCVGRALAGAGPMNGSVSTYF